MDDRWPLVVIEHLVTMCKTLFLLSLKCRRERACGRMKPCSYVRIDVGNTCLISVGLPQWHDTERWRTLA